MLVLCVLLLLSAPGKAVVTKTVIDVLTSSQESDTQLPPTQLEPEETQLPPVEGTQLAPDAQLPPEETQLPPTQLEDSLPMEDTQPNFHFGLLGLAYPRCTECEWLWPRSQKLCEACVANSTRPSTAASSSDAHLQTRSDAAAVVPGPMTPPIPPKTKPSYWDIKYGLHPKLDLDFKPMPEIPVTHNPAPPEPAQPLLNRDSVNMDTRCSVCGGHDTVLADGTLLFPCCGGIVPPEGATPVDLHPESGRYGDDSELSCSEQCSGLDDGVEELLSIPSAGSDLTQTADEEASHTAEEITPAPKIGNKNRKTGVQRSISKTAKH